MPSQRMKTTEELLTPKELAALLKHDVKYVYEMKRLGFLMPGNRATLAEARLWLVAHPKPRRDRWRPKRTA